MYDGNHRKTGQERESPTLRGKTEVNNNPAAGARIQSVDQVYGCHTNNNKGGENDLKRLALTASLMSPNKDETQRRQLFSNIFTKTLALCPT